MAARRYNFNVIYNRTHGRSDTISVFVEYVVETLLEREIGKDGNDLVGYYADRDMLPGRNLFDENFRVIKNSDYTIVVFDKGFITKPWPMYLNHASFKKLIDEGPGLNGQQRFIPIAFNLEPETIERKCEHLNCQEVIYFKDDYRLDEKNKRRLVRVIKDGLPLSDEEIRYVPEILENRGPSNENPIAEDKGSVAVGPLSEVASVSGVKRQDSEQGPVGAKGAAEFDSADGFKSLESSLHGNYEQVSSMGGNKSLPQGVDLAAAEAVACVPSLGVEVSLPKQPIHQGSLRQEFFPPIQKKSPASETEEDIPCGLPPTDMSSIATVQTDNEARLREIVPERNGERRVTSEAKTKPYTNTETHLAISTDPAQGTAGLAENPVEETALDDAPDQVDNERMEATNLRRNSSFVESVHIYGVRYVSQAEQRSLMAAPGCDVSSEEQRQAASLIQWRTPKPDDPEEDETLVKSSPSELSVTSGYVSEESPLEESGRGEFDQTPESTQQHVPSRAHVDEEVSPSMSKLALGDDSRHDSCQAMGDNRSNREETVPTNREKHSDVRMEIDVQDGTCNSQTDSCLDETKVLKTDNESRNEDGVREREPRRHLRAEFHLSYGTRVWQRMTSLAADFTDYFIG